MNLARNMTAPPPEAVLDLIEADGGKVVYAHKKAALIHQSPGRPVRLRVSARESYDLEGWPLTFKWTVLYGDLQTEIKTDGDSGEALITVPGDRRLPKGRTVILLTADNGLTQGNPAVISVYRSQGRDNKRPVIEGLKDLAVFAGRRGCS